MEDIPRSYLCECLGIDAGYIAGGNEGGSVEEYDLSSSFKPWNQRKDYDVMYARADPILFVCKICGKQHSFRGYLDKDQRITEVGKFYCPEVGV